MCIDGSRVLLGPLIKGGAHVDDLGRVPQLVIVWPGLVVGKHVG